MPGSFDIDACTDLFTRHYSDLVRYARSVTGDEAGARDAVQEAFLRIWRRRIAIDPAQSARALLYRAVRNLMLNEARDAALHRDLTRTMNPAPPPSQPDALADVALIRVRLRVWIAELPQRRREAFELSRFHGFSHAEIAGIMGLSRKTVENHIRLALLHLRDRLQSFDPNLIQP